MIVWLASYPRSGNTLTRQILRQVLGRETWSRYNDVGDIATVEAVAAKVGHRTYQGDWADFLATARASDELYLIKTHEPPEDDAPAIYLVRDGRAAMVSWLHLLRALRRRDNVSLADIVEGRGVPFLGWSGHLDAWNPFARPATLVLRFEEVVRDPPAAAGRMASFLNLPPVGGWSNELETLRGLLPGFFRHGSTEANVTEMPPDVEARFWELHGPWMRRLGYGG